MKKCLALLLSAALVICMIGSAYSEESSSITIEPRFLTATDLTVTEWYSDNDYRTLLATCALLDLLLTSEETYTNIVTEAMRNNCVYVGKGSSSLYVFFWGDESVVFVQFTPAKEKAEVACNNLSYKYAERAMEGLVDDNLLRSYHQVDSEDILTIYELIFED